jgi:methionyl-tRNA formyltransferase
MRIIYAGSPEVALPPLKALHAAGAEIVAVLSQPDRPVGRKRILTPTPVSALAMELGLPVHHPHSAEELVRIVESADADLAIAVAYGRLIPPEVLTLPRHGWWNLHFSLLPRWRGATPVQHALLHGDEVTGLSVFRMDEGLDTGRVLAVRERRIRALDTASSLLADLSEEGATVLVELLSELEGGELRAVEQIGEPTYAPKLSRDEGRLDWTETASAVMNRYRAVTPEPGAFAILAGPGREIGISVMHPVVSTRQIPPGSIQSEGKKVIVGCAEGALELVRVKPAGKVEMDAASWWRGVDPETRFG